MVRNMTCCAFQLDHKDRSSFATIQDGILTRYISRGSEQDKDISVEVPCPLEMLCSSIAMSIGKLQRTGRDGLKGSKEDNYAFNHGSLAESRVQKSFVHDFASKLAPRSYLRSPNQQSKRNQRQHRTNTAQKATCALERHSSKHLRHKKRKCAT